MELKLLSSTSELNQWTIEQKCVPILIPSPKSMDTISDNLIIQMELEIAMKMIVCKRQDGVKAEK